MSNPRDSAGRTIDSQTAHGIVAAIACVILFGLWLRAPGTGAGVAASPGVNTSRPAAPIPARPAGLGVTRLSVQRPFDGLGMSFRGSTNVTGQPTVMGEASDSSALEIIGPPDDVQRVTLLVGIPNGGRQLTREGGIYMEALVDTAAPDWRAGVDWMTRALPRALSSGMQETTMPRHRRASVYAVPAAGIATFVIEATP